MILEEDLDGEQIESAVEDKSEVEDEEGEEEEEVMSGEEQGGIVSAVGDVSLAGELAPHPCLLILTTYCVAPTTNSSVAHEKASMGLKKLSMDVLVEVRRAQTVIASLSKSSSTGCIVRPQLTRHPSSLMGKQVF